MARNFIQESINEIREAADYIESIWKDFQKGDLSKDAFLNAYTHKLNSLREDTIEDAEFQPNNGCNFKDTVPDNKYFKQNNY